MKKGFNNFMNFLYCKDKIKNLYNHIKNISITTVEEYNFTIKSLSKIINIILKLQNLVINIYYAKYDIVSYKLINISCSGII